MYYKTPQKVKKTLTKGVFLIPKIRGRSEWDIKRETIDKIFYNKLGEILSRERRKRGYSLRYVAELTGISRTTIDKYELGLARIDMIRWKKICEALQLPENIHIKIALGLRDYE